MTKVQLEKFHLSFLELGPSVAGRGIAMIIKQALEAIKKSHEPGVKSIDTAPIYGYGRRFLVGKAIRELNRENVEDSHQV